MRPIEFFTNKNIIGKDVNICIRYLTTRNNQATNCGLLSGLNLVSLSFRSHTVLSELTLRSLHCHALLVPTKSDVNVAHPVCLSKLDFMKFCDSSLREINCQFFSV